MSSSKIIDLQNEEITIKESQANDLAIFLLEKFEEDESQTYNSFEEEKLLSKKLSQQFQIVFNIKNKIL